MMEIQTMRMEELTAQLDELRAQELEVHMYYFSISGLLATIYEGVRARVGQPSIYNSCRFSFKYVLNVLIEQTRQRVVK